MGLVYFVEGLSQVDEAVLRGRGLGYAFDGGRFGHRGGELHGLRGRFVADPSLRLAELPDPSTLKWVNVGGVVGSDEMAGVWLSEFGETKPEDLERRELISGTHVELREGERWLIPSALAYGDDGDTRLLLPGVLKWEGGKPFKEIRDELFLSLTRSALDFYRSIREGETTLYLSDEVAVRALSVNYRISFAEVSMLELLRDDWVIRIFRALADFGGMERVAKKKQAGAESVEEIVE